MRGTHDIHDTGRIEEIVRQVLAERLRGADTDAPAVDIASSAARREILVANPRDRDALVRLRASTPARIGIGRNGSRCNTRSLLLLLADHALARDAVLADVDTATLERLGLFSVQTLCADRDQHLTRPDLGRRFSPETLAELKKRCAPSPRVQVYVADGLSSAAVSANAENFLPALTDALARHGIGVGTPFFVRFGRVPSMDVIAPALDAEAVCLLIGERPGLGCAESMSAYLCYRPEEGMPESRRTVISNIHAGGIPAVEAGAYTADVLKKILDARKSGVDLKL
jgi:ethanolamine ammonia-lyase small subunit